MCNFWYFKYCHRTSTTYWHLGPPTLAIALYAINITVYCKLEMVHNKLKLWITLIWVLFFSSPVFMTFLWLPLVLNSPLLYFYITLQYIWVFFAFIFYFAIDIYSFQIRTSHDSYIRNKNALILRVFDILRVYLIHYYEYYVI